MILAFTRLVWRWDAKNIWWDESLSLQRAESPLPALVAGTFTFDDGFTLTSSTDQHPFLYFLLLGGLIRLAGESDLVLRFPSAAAATLLVPAAWAMARLLARRRVVPPPTPLWAAGLVALNPFLLWYGREARMYTLVPLLAIVSTYWLLRWTEAPAGKRRLYFAFYAVALALLLCTHYLAFLILPVQALLIFLHLTRENRRRAIVAALAMLGLGLLIGLAAERLVLQGLGSGSNFSRVSLPILAADLLNAFSLGLSVDITLVRWLDYTFAVVAILGALWPFRSRRSVPGEAWLLPAFVILPVLELDIIQRIQPAYMNARHMSMISVAFALLAAAGCAAVWQERRWAGALLGALLVAGMSYSTVSYFAAPQYARDDFAQVGRDLAAEIQPGDAVVLVPPQMIRLYRHYLPIDTLEAAKVEETATSTPPLRGWAALPQINQPFEATEARLQQMLQQYKRVWVVASGMVPLTPYQKETREWLASHAFLARDLHYQSNTLLWLKLYLPQPPILSELPANVGHRVSAVFGDKIRLDGYTIGQPLTSASSTPVTLYWQPLEKISRRYKYILRLVSVAEDGSLRTLSRTEHEPYNGSLPTIWWSPGPEIFEYTGLPQPAPFDGSAASLRLAMEMYDAETLEKLPVTETPEGGSLADEHTVLMPFEQ